MTTGREAQLAFAGVVQSADFAGFPYPRTSPGTPENRLAFLPGPTARPYPLPLSAHPPFIVCDSRMTYSAVVPYRLCRSCTYLCSIDVVHPRAPIDICSTNPTARPEHANVVRRQQRRRLPGAPH